MFIIGLLVVLASMDCKLVTAQIANIRLVNGTHQDGSDGRLEVLHNGTWGTVCDDKFDSNASKVVCHMLGYTGDVFLSKSIAHYGQGTGKIWLDDVTCDGNETSLFSCRTRDWGTTNCDHNEDVGVNCDPDQDAYLTLRLVNGSNSNEGRVEVQHGVNGTWGTICDDGWNDKAALVVCKQITGLDENDIIATPVTDGGFGQGQGVIWLDDIRCTGMEKGLGSCDYRPWGQSNCGHNEDAGVTCRSKYGHHSNVTVRLQDGASTSQGRVEIWVNHVWGTVCGDKFDDRDAIVICRMLGLRGGIVSTTFRGGVGPIWLAGLECKGNETTIDDCIHKPWGTNNCGHTEDAGVICTQNSGGCSNIQCQNGGTCIDGITEFACHCRSDWTGKYCERNIDECSSSPCRNGAVCTDGIGYFNCTCSTGWTGQHCETALTSVVSSGELMCFACDYTTALSYCDSVQTCQPNQMCFLQRSKNSNGHNHFRSGCQDRQKCTQHNAHANDTCLECCDGSFCNSKGCGDNGFPPKGTRGPICLDCAYASNPRECDRVTICGSDEFCHVEELQWGAKSIFHLGCKSNHECAFETRSLAGNTRELVQRSVPLCKACCQGDFCNTNCTRHVNSNHIIVG